VERCDVKVLNGIGLRGSFSKLVLFSCQLGIEVEMTKLTNVI
jgi:hypothetical protein